MIAEHSLKRQLCQFNNCSIFDRQTMNTCLFISCFRCRSSNTILFQKQYYIEIAQHSPQNIIKITDYFSLQYSQSNLLISSLLSIFIKLLTLSVKILIQSLIRQTLYFKILFGSKNYTPQTNMQHQSLIVSFTGFDSEKDDKIADLLKKVQAIGCQYIKAITNATNVLIVNKTCTEKYQMAQLPNSSVDSVTEKWVNESFRCKKILDTKKYKINKIFYGVRIAVMGFQKQKSEKIEKLLKQNGAKLQTIEIDSQKLHQIEFPDVIVSNRAYLKKMDLYLQKINTPIVQIDWLDQSLAQKICKFPKNYAINRYYAYQSQLGTKELNRLAHRLSKIIQIQTFTFPNNLLSEEQEPYIIYLDTNTIHKDLLPIFKKIICLFGGIYIEILNPIISHLLVGDLSEKEYLNLMKQIGCGQIFRVEWLIDTILFGCKMREKDYKVRSFKERQTASQLQQINTNSFSFQHSFVHLNRHNSTQESNRKTISGVLVSQLEPKQIKVMKTRPMKTQIFKNRVFFIESSQRKASQLTNIPTKIKENGGEVYDNPFKNKKNYLVMKDSENNSQIIQQFMKKNRIEIIPVSIRWIDYCIKKGQFIEHNTQDILIFKPFSFTTPISDFMRMKFDILGVNEVFTRRLKELLSVLGSSEKIPNKSELTHCLCGSEFRESNRYREIRRENKTVKFYRYEWLIEIVNNNGRLNRVEGYQIQVQDEVSGQQQKNDAKTPQKLVSEKYNRQLPTQQRQQNSY